MASGKNRLADETSPYLLQHADNPVDWYPWCADALTKARDEDKPILLSIGYSACHWCHVMAHESFEDDSTAETMNEHFVNIKVDREERPDLDKVYQTAHQLLTQQGGGWPLTMFLDPNTLMPFFGGTYFPKTPRYQLPGFVDLLLRVSQVFRDQRDELAAQGTKLANVLDSAESTNGARQSEGRRAAARGTRSAREPIRRARRRLRRRAEISDADDDRTPAAPLGIHRTSHGAPKDRETLEMAMITLTHIARGGIYDHVGGGFCRYSTDARWMIPHFEKMLYDNGALLGVYADALAIGPDPLFEAAVRETAAWLMREMQHPDGGYFSALDADSEGEEGKFYVWRRDEVKRLLSEDEYLVVETLYGLDKPANFEGKWNLHRTDAWHAVVDRSRDRARRSRRVARERAGKTVRRAQQTGSARQGRQGAHRVERHRDPRHGARRSRAGRTEVDRVGDARGRLHLRTKMVVDGALYATWRNGRARHPAYLDDYANLLDGLLALLQVRWRDADAALAKTLADTVARALLRQRRRRLLLHRARSRTVDSSAEAVDGRRDAAGQRRARACVESARTPARRSALSRCRERHVEVGAHRDGAVPGRTQHAARGARRRSESPPELSSCAVLAPNSKAGCDRCARAIGHGDTRSAFRTKTSGVMPTYLPRLVSAEKQRQCTAYVCQGLSCSLPIHSQEELAAALKTEST